MSRRLRYSERKRLAETGSLGDLVHDRVSRELATAVLSLLARPAGGTAGTFYRRLQDACIQYFGVDQRWDDFVVAGPPDPFLDFVEIAVEEAQRRVVISVQPITPITNCEEKMNILFERFRFGYRIEGGEAHKIGSPTLEAEVIGPALLSVRRKGWEEVERSFREALDHQRGGETDDALTAANAAVEAALKAIGMKGNTLKELSRGFKNAGIVPGYLANVPDLLEDLLDRLHAVRSTAGDAHGKGPGAPEVPQELADLAIHWAGAFIVYLSDATR